MTAPPESSSWIPVFGGSSRHLLEGASQRDSCRPLRRVSRCTNGLVAACLGLLVLVSWRTARSWVTLSGGLRAPSSSSSSRLALQASTADASSAGGLTFTPREVGSAEQLMLMRRPDNGRIVTTHSFTVLVKGKIKEPLLREALKWSIARHPQLRSKLRPPSPLTDENAPMPLRGEASGRWMWEPTALSVDEVLEKALDVSQAPSGKFEESWKAAFEDFLQGVLLDLETGPVWQLRLVQGADESALVFAFDHAADDQRSANLLVHELLTHMDAAEKGSPPAYPPAPLEMPAALEEAMLQEELDVWKLGDYALSQVAASSRPSIKLPSSLRSSSEEETVKLKNWLWEGNRNPRSSDRPLQIPKQASQGAAAALTPETVPPDHELSSTQRRTILATRRIPQSTVQKLREKCRSQNVTATMLLAAAAVLAVSDVSHDDMDAGYEEYRTLLGVDMRPFAKGGDWTGGTVAFGSGALDFTMRLLPKSGMEYQNEQKEGSTHSAIGGVNIWDVARTAANYTRSWIEKGWAAESTRLFDLGTRMIQMENIVLANADDPGTLGRGYTLTMSNAGVYQHGEGTYGRLDIDGIYFGISQGVTGSLLYASWQTVGGELYLTAFAPAPIIDEARLDAFADSAIRSVTTAAEAPAPAPRPGGNPRQDYLNDIRGGAAWYLPQESPKGGLECPLYEEIKSSTLPPFQVDKYMGIWYELAFHDITQPNMCGCTRFNMTNRGGTIEDMFTVSCPWPWREGVDGPWLPGFNKAGERRLNLYTCNMTMFYEPARPGVMMEDGFGVLFPNMVLEIWKDPEITAATGYEYTRALQFQCVSKGPGKIEFTGINFLSRQPVVPPTMLHEMFVKARALGLEPYGSNDMHVVNHEGCRYPSSTDSSVLGQSFTFPSPVLEQELGSNVLR
eukprot:TRINITY_DN3497_c0_g1_i1.p1 TRINITY_DN3497_c0_g1~~TRINITY_DN3497_c0_g1_i1.p1  ORF type:complete len:905 (+),score=212.67 TRINITY_DN3497_c0_g1_i1:59-2773(+)